MESHFLRQRKLYVTLWGDIAEELDENAILAHHEPIVVILAAMTVRTFRC